jgi:hypothetical protein
MHLSPELTGWLLALLEGVVVAAALACVYEGMRRFALLGFGRFTAVMVAAGLLVSVGESASSLYVASQLRHLLAAFPSVVQAEPPEGWERAPMSPQERTERSTENARLTYRVSGRIVPFIDAGGDRMLYVPTQEELRAREQTVLGFERTEAESLRLAGEGWRQMVGVIVLMAGGWLVGRRARRAASR